MYKGILKLNSGATMKSTPTPLFAVKTDRNHWIEKAGQYSQIATTGHGRGRRSWPFTPNAPTLHLEHEASLHVRAAEAYRICGDRWLDSADAYARAAFVQAHQLRCPEEAVAYYLEAAMTAEKVRSADSEKYYALVQSQYCEVAKYSLAGRAQKRIAVERDKEGDFEAAIEAYQRASNFFLADGMDSQADTIFDRMAHLMGLIKQYQSAAMLYEKLGRKKLENNLTKKVASKYFFRSGLLYLAMGNAKEKELEEKLAEFEQTDHHFKKSREVIFLHNLATAVSRNDLGMYADHVYNYDSSSPLDVWSLKLLALLRHQIESTDNEA